MVVNLAQRQMMQTGEVVNFRPKKDVKLKKDGTPKNTTCNSPKGKHHTVYPLKNKEDIESIKQYFRNKMNEAKNDEDRQVYAKYLLMFVIGINVGLRAGDLLNLTWNQIFDTNNNFVDGIRIQEDKTEKYKTFFLNQSAQDAITEYINEFNPLIEPELHLFRSREGGAIKVNTAWDALKKAAKECGIKQNIGTHTMRKTWGYFQLKAHSGDLMFITYLQNLFNHSSQIATLRYCGLEDEDNKVFYNDINL